ncbi:hypothetical protein JW905_18855 [bacterium]|nr:hypothetical protein [candidate division CSSED10-310 bacterium]
MSAINNVTIRTFNQTAAATRRSGSSGFATFLKAAGKTLGAAGRAAAPFIPGGPIVQAAIEGAAAGASDAAMVQQAGTNTGTTNGNYDSGTGTESGMSMSEALAMQIRIQKEVVMFSTLSNVAKARHDASMSAVRNIK